MKQIITILLLLASFSVANLVSSAGTLKPDCSAKKAGKNMAMKATVAVGGRCSPMGAARGSAKDMLGIDGEGKHKSKNKDKSNTLKNEHNGQTKKVQTSG
jgi:hypothetical protein